MKKSILFFILSGILFGTPYAVPGYLPQNVRFDVCTVNVAAGQTKYSKFLYFASQSSKIGKISITDTTLSSQKTLNIGAGDTAGVRILQELCFPFGNETGYKARDTVCDLCGDTTLTLFKNATKLSKDSLICATMDTTKMVLKEIGGDTLYISKGYFSMVPDPSPVTRFKVIGNAALGTIKRVFIYIWSFEGTPIYQEK